MRWLTLNVLWCRFVIGVGRSDEMPRGYKSEDRQDETVSIENVYVKHATEKALLCMVRGEEMWIPRSQIKEDSEVLDDLDNDSGTLVISKWIAEQKGLVE